MPRNETSPCVEADTCSVCHSWPCQDDCPTKTRTFGETYNDPTSNLRRNIDKAEAQTQPIKEAVAALTTKGMSGEQAWTEVLKHVSH